MKGFAADTMHMARLMDAARQSYSLESLTDEMLNKRKVPMKERFSVPKITASGPESKMKVLPLMKIYKEERNVMTLLIIHALMQNRLIIFVSICKNV